MNRAARLTLAIAVAATVSACASGPLYTGYDAGYVVSERDYRHDSPYAYGGFDHGAPAYAYPYAYPPAIGGTYYQGGHYDRDRGYDRGRRDDRDRRYDSSRRDDRDDGRVPRESSGRQDRGRAEPSPPVTRHGEAGNEAGMN